MMAGPPGPFRSSWIPWGVSGLVLVLLVAAAARPAGAKEVCTNFINKCQSVDYNLAIAKQQGDTHVTEGWWRLPPGKSTRVCYDVEAWAALTVSYYFTATDSPGWDKESTLVPDALETWGGSSWAQGEYCIKKGEEFTLTDAHSRACGGSGEMRATFFRTKSSDTFTIDVCEVCAKFVNKCPEAYDLALAYQPSGDAGDGKFVADGWWTVKGNADKFACWYTGPGGASEGRVGVHFEYSSPESSGESVVEPVKRLDWPGLDTGYAYFCLNTAEPDKATSDACSGASEMNLGFWYMARPWPFTIDGCRARGTRVASESAPAPAPASDGDWYLRYLPPQSGTKCRSVAGTYPLINRWADGRASECPYYTRVVIGANCWVAVHIRNGDVLRNIYYVPGTNPWRGDFTFIQDAMGDRASWPGAGGPPLPQVTVGCQDRRTKQVAGTWHYTLGGWGRR